MVFTGGVRYSVCRNETEAEKDRADRLAIVDCLQRGLKREDRALIDNVAYWRYVIVGTDDDAPLTDRQKPWRWVRMAAELEDARTHDFRHSFASEAVMGGESLPMVGADTRTHTGAD